MMTVKQAKAIAERYAKAVELVEQGKVAPVYGQSGVYVVLNGEGVAYLVDVARETCSCPDYQYRAKKLNLLCKHLLAVALYREHQPDPNGGGRGRSPRRRYQCDRCGSVVESDEDRTGERCLACLAIDPTAPRGRYQAIDEDELERCEWCGSELDEHGECGACIAEHERTYGGSLVRDADGIVTEIW
jgi:predicted nucleic acid-binding Zn finger protein